MSGTQPRSTTPMAAAARPIAAIAVVLSIVLLVVAAVSCGPSDDPPASPPTSSSTPGAAVRASDSVTATSANTIPAATTGVSSPASPSVSPTTVRAIAVEVYLAMWRDMVEAGKTADYSSPRLADHATSQALQLLYQGLLAAYKENLVIKGEPRFSPVVTGVTPESSPVAVSIVDCMDDSRWLNYRADGRLEDDSPGGKRKTTATVGLIDGRWLVTRLEVAAIGTCS